LLPYLFDNNAASCADSEADVLVLRYIQPFIEMLPITLLANDREGQAR